MNYFSLILFCLVCCVGASDTPTNDVEDNFHLFFKNFEAEVHAKSADTDIMGGTSTEQGSYSSISNAELLKHLIKEFRPIAHEIFLDAAFNRKKEYYVLNEEQSLWHKPDQDFGKIIFYGFERNQRIVQDKMASAWQENIDRWPHSSLQARRVGSFIRFIRNLVSKPKNVIHPVKMGKPENMGKLGNTAAISTKGKLMLATISGVGFYIWGKEPSSSDEIGTFKYRLGKKVLTNDMNVYFIWYGNWNKSSSRIETMEYLAGHISDSKWYSPMRDYYFQESIFSSKVYVNGSVHFKKSYFDNYSNGKSLTGESLTLIIKNQLEGSAPDPNGIYFVFGSSDITEEFTTEWEACGYHTYTSEIANYPTYYSYIYSSENEKRCQISFGSQERSPNSDIELDSMASIFAHELVETVSDPITSDPSWISRSGLENADLCAWKFGVYSMTNDNKFFNAIVGERNFMLQQNIDIKIMNCSSGLI